MGHYTISLNGNIHIPKGLSNGMESVLDSETQERGNTYIHNNIRICYRHFAHNFRLPSNRLTKNAIPTLNLLKRSAVVMGHSLPVQPSTSTVTYDAEVLPMSTSTDHKSLLQVTPPLYPKKVCSSKKGTKSTITQLRHKLQKMQNKCKTQAKKIMAAKKLTMSKSFLKMIEKLPDAAQTFIKLQTKYKKKPRGRRYITHEKIMALTIFKQSPKAYNLLNKMFVLPSKRCLQKLLSSFRVRPGINTAILENLKKCVQRMPDEKRYVNLLFDEVSLAPGLTYNASQNEIIGFQDNGEQKSQYIADHALVFMIKGLKSKTKQPICFTFCKSGTKEEDLKALLLKVIKAINQTGLKVVATTCNQHPTNVAVIKELKEDTNKKYAIEGVQGRPLNAATCFEVNNMKVFPLFDTPHLLKGTRNNLLIKDAQFMQNGKEKCAKWEHLKMLLAIDVGDDEIRLVNKLTESHVNKEKIKKMKVKLAAQVFSQRVSSAMRFLANKYLHY